MTVIAWDGKTLAADKSSTCAGFSSTTTKIHRVPDGIVALAGDAEKAVALLDWFRRGRVPENFLTEMQKENCADAIFIDRKGCVFSYGKTAFGMQSEQPFTAMGCGRDYALAAMHLGHDARRAVEVACALDVFCGNGIDTLTLD